jgi:hypothetical protein
MIQIFLFTFFFFFFFPFLSRSVTLADLVVKSNVEAIQWRNRVDNDGASAGVTLRVRPPDGGTGRQRRRQRRRQEEEQQPDTGVELLFRRAREREHALRASVIASSVAKETGANQPLPVPGRTDRTARVGMLFGLVDGPAGAAAGSRVPLGEADDGSVTLTDLSRFIPRGPRAARGAADLFRATPHTVTQLPRREYARQLVAAEQQNQS